MSKDRFRKISEISLSDSSSWMGKIFLTFDIDWACDEVIEDTVDLVETGGVSATWFVTHPTPVLTRIRRNPRFELGIHPNFNRLLFEGDTCNGKSPQEIVANLLKVVPEAQAVRSHSMTQSSPLLDLFRKSGMSFDCNVFIPSHSNIPLAPWRHWNGLIKIPYCWEDDVHLIENQNFDVASLLAMPGLKVFDFHPIHVSLNTRTIHEYEATRPIQNNYLEVIRHRQSNIQNTEGSRDRLLGLLKFA